MRTQGKGGHGSQPDVAVDPVLTAAHVVVALQSVVSRSVPTKEEAVVSCTMIHGGEVHNVIPDKVHRRLTRHHCTLSLQREVKLSSTPYAELSNQALALVWLPVLAPTPA